MESAGRKKAEFSFANGKKIIIEVCDLFKQKGLKVIHCHNTFDTDCQVIKNHSVMGQFTDVCNTSNVDLDSIIEEWIEKNARKAYVNEFLPCRKKTFTLGEICPVSVGEDEYALASFEDLQSFLDYGSMELNSYLFFLDNLWKCLGQSGMNTDVVNVPAFGNKIVNIRDLSFTIDQKITLIAMSFLKSVRKYGTMNTLKICVYEGDVNTDDLSAWYAKWNNALLPFLSQFSKLPLGFKEIYQSGAYVGMPFEVTPTAKIPGNKEKLNIFISHASKDEKESTEIYNKLKEAGFDCWMDLYDIRPGHKYAGEIIRGFKQSDVIVTILSKNSLSSEGVLNEMDNAYKKNKYVIPFRIDDTELNEEFEFYLSNKQWINAFPNYEMHISELISALHDYER